MASPRDREASPAPGGTKSLNGADFQGRRFKSGDVLNITLTHLGLGEGTVFLERAVDGPASDLAGCSNDAAGAVPALIAVNKHGVAALVEHNTQNGLHCLLRDILLLSTLHVEDDMADTIILNERAKVDTTFVVLIDKCPAFEVSFIVL